MLEGVGVDRLGRTAVDGEVGLAVAVEVEPTNRDAFLDRLLEDPGRHVASFPVDGARQADVDGDDTHHFRPPFDWFLGETGGAMWMQVARSFVLQGTIRSIVLTCQDDD